MTEPTQSKFVFLSEFIEDIAADRRPVFIRTLKDAIRTGVFEGAPMADRFSLKFQGRNTETRQVENKTEDHRDIAVKNTPEFEKWLTRQQAIKGRQAGAQYPTKEDLLAGEAGEAAFSKAVAQFRRRGNANSKRSRPRA